MCFPLSYYITYLFMFHGKISVLLLDSLIIWFHCGSGTIDEWIYMMFVWNDECLIYLMAEEMTNEEDVCEKQLSASAVTKTQVWSGRSRDGSVRDARLEWSRVWRDREWDLYVILYMYFIIYIKFVNNQCDCHSIH